MARWFFKQLWQHCCQTCSNTPVNTFYSRQVLDFDFGVGSQGANYVDDTFYYYTVSESTYLSPIIRKLWHLKWKTFKNSLLSLTPTNIGAITRSSKPSCEYLSSHIFFTFNINLFDTFWKNFKIISSQI